MYGNPCLEVIVPKSVFLLRYSFKHFIKIFQHSFSEIKLSCFNSDTILRFTHMPNTNLAGTWSPARTAWDNRCGICEHLSPTHHLCQALIAGLPAKLNSAQLHRHAGGQCLRQIMCRRTKCSHMPQRCPRQCRRPCPYENHRLQFIEAEIFARHNFLFGSPLMTYLFHFECFSS